MLALALTGLAAAVWRHGGDAVLLAAAVAIGLTLPAFSAALRALWPQVIPGHSDGAYAFDTLLYELSLIISPAIVGLIATLISAPLALVLLACAGTAGTAIVATTPAAWDFFGRSSQAGRRRTPTSSGRPRKTYPTTDSTSPNCTGAALPR
jgi:hypothetical protein